MARIIDGKAYAEGLRARIGKAVKSLQAEHGLTPGLAVVLVGEDPASKVYVATKAKQTVVVSIDANKQFYVGTTKVTIEELKARLQPFLAKESDQPSIVINADKTVPIDDVVAVMRVARELGARTVLAVDKNGAQ